MTQPTPNNDENDFFISQRIKLVKHHWFKDRFEKKKTQE
jgi:hypothetical protein